VSVPLWFQVSTLAVLGVLLVVDLLVVARRPHVPSLRECTFWVVGYVALAGAFAGVLAVVGSGDLTGQFVAGWLTEYSLSVDNLFVFVIIMSRFAVPRGNQQKVLMMGIILSLVLRGACIALGAAAIERFSWVFYLFGGFLVFTAVQLLRGSGDDDEYEENVLIRQARRLLPIAADYDGSRMTTRQAGRRLLTPMVIVFVAIGSTDLLFALDSIPAIFGLTQDPFVVFTATIFALMGLRQLYFLLGGLLDRLVYLSLGLSLILAFIGVKLILEALHTNELAFVNGGEAVHWAPAIPTSVSLGVIVAVLALTTLASLLGTRRERLPEPALGAVAAQQPGRPEPARPDPSRPDPSRPDPSRPDPSRPEPMRPESSRPEVGRVGPSRRPRAPHPAPVARSAARGRTGPRD
jgi:tellurite resistance protein TerC